MSPSAEILTIIPADGWWALSPYNGEIVRLACFALVGGDERGQRIVGLDALLDPAVAPEANGAEEYVFLGRDPSPGEVEHELARVRAEIADAGEERTGPGGSTGSP